MRLAPATLAVAVALLVLGGCSVVATPPPPPTEEEAQRYYDSMLERTWIGTGLSGLLDQPQVAAVDRVPSEEWRQVLSDCMEGKGLSLPGFVWDPQSGYQLVDDGTSPTAARIDSTMRLAFYMCLAANPPEVIDEEAFLTPAQLDYVYDYYVRWIVPCLAQNGWQLRNAPSREEFLLLEGNWSPYNSIEVDDVGDFETSEELCGPSRPPLR